MNDVLRQVDDSGVIDGIVVDCDCVADSTQANWK